MIDATVWKFSVQLGKCKKIWAWEGHCNPHWMQVTCGPRYIHGVKGSEKKGREVDSGEGTHIWWDCIIITLGKLWFSGSLPFQRVFTLLCPFLFFLVLHSFLSFPLALSFLSSCISLPLYLFLLASGLQKACMIISLSFCLEIKVMLKRHVMLICYLLF